MQLFIAIALFFLIILSLAPGRVAFTQDLALSVVVGELGATGELALLGPPSHRGGRHLGALYYWLVSAADLLSDSIFRTLTILVAINSVCIFPLLAARSRVFAAGACVVLSSAAFLFVIRDPWHSHFLILFGVCAVHSALRALDDEKKYLPWFLFFSSCVVLTHFSGLPLILGLSLVLALVFLLRRNSLPLSLLISLPTFAALLVWIPSIFGIISQPDNFARALRPEHAPFYYSESFRLITALFTRFSFIESTWPVNFRGTNLLSETVWIGAFLMLVSSNGFRSRKQMERVSLLVVPFLVYGISLLFLELPFHLYFIYGLIPILPFLWGFTFEESVQLITDFFQGRRSMLVLPALLLLFGAVFITLIQLISSLPILFSRPIPKYLSVAAAEQITDAIRLDSNQEPYDIIARGHTISAEDSYRAFLGKEHYSRMFYADRFPELVSLTQRERQIFDLSYLVICPKPNPKWQKRLHRTINKTWKEEAKIQLGNSDLEKTCEITRLRRKLSSP